MNLPLDWIADTEYPNRARPALGFEFLSVNGLTMHVEAYRVEERDGVQEPVSEDHRPELEALWSLCGDNPLQTVELPGLTGQWVVCMFPHGA